MARIVRTASAKSDISTIADFIAADNPTAADRWLDEIDQTLSLIAAYPQIGERVEYLAPGIRRRTLGCYLLFYRVIDGGIELRRVIHGARRIEDLLL
jgi:toxin ParE1/3/4